MDEKRLAEIEALASRACIERSGVMCPCGLHDQDIPDLIAEVRRLRAEFDRFKANARKYGIARDVEQQHA